MIAPPTQVRGIGKYEWLFTSLGDAALPPMSSWLVPIINGPTRRTARHVASGHTSAPGSTSGATSGTSGATSDTTTRGSTGESTYEPRPFEFAVVHDLFRKASKYFPNSCEEGDTTSVYSSSKSWSPYLVAHHYYTGVGGRRCPFDGPLHESDNFCLLVRGCRLFYKCYSPSCSEIDPFMDHRGCLGTILPILPGDVSFQSEKAYEIYQGACLRAQEAAQAEGPGDAEDATDNNDAPLPTLVLNACKRNILALLNNYLFFC